MFSRGTSKLENNLVWGEYEVLMFEALSFECLISVSIITCLCAYMYGLTISCGSIPFSGDSFVIFRNRLDEQYIIKQMFDINLDPRCMYKGHVNA